LILQVPVANTQLLRFHHIGLAVSEPEPAFRFLAFQGYIAGNQVFDPLQGVNLAMRHHETMPDFEVIWPGDEPSPIDKMIKRHGTLMYHCCYEATDIAAALQAIADSGFDAVAVSPPKPAILFGGREVSFYMIDGFGLIELLAALPPPR
jgi:hypothetical protein